MAIYALISVQEKKDDVPHSSIQEANLSLLPVLTNRPLSAEMKARGESEREKQMGQRHARRRRRGKEGGERFCRFVG